ncbi:adenylate/guanylate cyclase domain-containing protein [Variovorax terrae]|uniref:Guanylate cyclase domain-containing protein n=1 Tax=Variovorax terrae TaxID=2923278 RepID=A0A9X1VUK8_9BURK|nr:adenylate/guanylate cyclase domain-containing protein [Variovorax terrae]MCJ0763540.1 hypothetical protein [Variovorax terrae]
MNPEPASPPPTERPGALSRNVVVTLLYASLAGLSRYTAAQQEGLRARFGELVRKALLGLDNSPRIVMDSADGTSVCFLGDPEEALLSARLLRDLLVQRYSRMLSARIGLHLGPVRLVSGAAERTNVLGDGINVAQRVMDFAQPNQIVVSRAYHDLLARLCEQEAGHQFDPLGPHLDKHLRAHEIYAVLPPQPRPPAPAPDQSQLEHTSPQRGLAVPAPDVVAAIESELERLIGPLARVLVHKALPRVVSTQALRELLACAIPDAAARDNFANLRAAGGRPA